MAVGAKPPALDVLEVLRCEQAPGEDLYETALRLVTQQVYHEAGGSQVHAAELAGVSVRVMNYRLQTHGLRPIDQNSPR